MDLEIGKLCQYTPCGVKDFLPFQCNLCKKNFCLEHFKNHECQIKNETKNIKKKTKINKYRCCVKNCREKSFTMLKCFECGKHYCLKHRYPDLHQCKINIKK